jgi:hypothetical protein
MEQAKMAQMPRLYRSTKQPQFEGHLARQEEQSQGNII